MFLGPSDALAAHLCSEIVQGPQTLENVSPEGPRTLSPYACAAKSPKAKLSWTPPRDFIVWACGGNHLKEGYRYLYD